VPFAGLILLSNTLYGTAARGGSSDGGTLFAINTDGTGFTNLHSFNGSGGAGSVSGLILSGNTLYGTTEYGGSSGNGSLFAVNTDGTSFTNLYGFTPLLGSYPYTNSDGAYPVAGLILSGNTLYGTARGGGSSPGNGTVFSLSLESISAPPQITCPTNITVEFTSTEGAVVSFAPTASDTCSGPPAVSCAPGSDSTFPIGTTTVLCTATDCSGNSASCSFQVTVLGARGVKQNVLADLKALQGNLVRSRDNDSRMLDRVVRFLAASLNSRFWVDETHLRRLGGSLAIREEAVAVHELQELTRSRPGPAPADILQGFIQRVVKSDRLLAVVNIQDASRGGAKPRRIHRAWLEVSKGDTQASVGHYGEAIEEYQDAWSEAQIGPTEHQRRAESKSEAAHDGGEHKGQMP
jgi:uncharacterized repeat protein (TIGR03803 family)